MKKSKKRLFADAGDKVVVDQSFSDTSPEKKRNKELSFLLNKLTKLNLEVTEFERFKKEVIWFAQSEGLNNNSMYLLKSSEKETGFLFLAHTYLERLGCKGLEDPMKSADPINNIRESIRSFLMTKYSNVELS